MRARRRVVLFVPGYTERNGGLARHGRELAQGFLDAGWDVRVVARAGGLRVPRIVRAGRLRVLELPGFDRRRVGAALYLAVAVPLGVVWTRRAVGAIGLHLGTTTVAAGISARVWGRPYLGLSTSSGPDGEVAEAARCRPDGLRRRVLAGATWLVGQSEHTAPELLALTSPDRVTVVPNPVRLPDPAPLTGRPRVLYLGRLSSEKDPGTLVRAWPAVLAEVPDARLDFVGVGGEWRSVEADVRREVAADPTLATSVSFRGWTDDVPGVLREHDVYVCSSISEGMSNSLLEACAHGRVVVASDIGPNRAVLGDDHPLLFPASDASALAATLLLALQDDTVRADAVQRARAAVQRNDAGAVVAAHARLLEGPAQDRPATTSS